MPVCTVFCKALEAESVGMAGTGGDKGCSNWEKNSDTYLYLLPLQLLYVVRS
jgi:hypothetical protein